MSATATKIDIKQAAAFALAQERENTERQRRDAAESNHRGSVDTLVHIANLKVGEGIAFKFTTDDVLFDTAENGIDRSNHRIEIGDVTLSIHRPSVNMGTILEGRYKKAKRDIHSAADLGRLIEEGDEPEFDPFNED